MKNSRLSTRLALDWGLFAAVSVLMAYSFTGNVLHELLGMWFLVLVSIHLAWARSQIWRRRILNSVLLFSFLVVSITGILSSQSLFSWIPWERSLSIRQIHVASGNWFLIFASLHIGLHWNFLSRRIFHSRNSRRLQIAFWILAAIPACLGGYVFLLQETYYKLILYYSFRMIDESQNGVLEIVQSLLTMSLFAFLAYAYKQTSGMYAAQKNPDSFC